MNADVALEKLVMLLPCETVVTAKTFVTTATVVTIETVVTCETVEHGAITTEHGKICCLLSWIRTERDLNSCEWEYQIHSYYTNQVQQQLLYACLYTMLYAVTSMYNVSHAIISSY